MLKWTSFSKGCLEEFLYCKDPFAVYWHRFLMPIVQMADVVKTAHFESRWIPIKNRALEKGSWNGEASCRENVPLKYQRKPSNQSLVELSRMICKLARAIFVRSRMQFCIRTFTSIRPSSARNRESVKRVLSNSQAVQNLCKYRKILQSKCRHVEENLWYSRHSAAPTSLKLRTPSKMKNLATLLEARRGIRIGARREFVFRK